MINYKYLLDGWTSKTTPEQSTMIRGYVEFKSSSYPIEKDEIGIDTLIVEYLESGYNLFFIIWTIEKLIEYDLIYDLPDISPFIKHGLTPDELHEIALTFFSSLVKG